MDTLELPFLIVFIHLISVVSYLNLVFILLSIKCLQKNVPIAGKINT